MHYVAAAKTMRRLENPRRAERLMREAVSRFNLVLEGIDVLTEAASGNFALTPLLAGLAGARQVIALTRDSTYGSAAEVEQYIRGYAAALGVSGRIEITQDRLGAFSKCSLITNLGFVRPINAAMVAALPSDAAIALMWEPWEFRSDDIDLAACRARQIPVLGTRETDLRLDIFRYIGMLALKLLLEIDIEIFRGRFLVIGTSPFLAPTVDALNAHRAQVVAIEPSDAWRGDNSETLAAISDCDALVVVDHRSGRDIIGGNRGVPVAWLANSGTPVIHICGRVDDAALSAAGVHKHPTRKVVPGYMTVTTDYVGPRPVVDLHAAGLKVGEMLVRDRRAGFDVATAVQHAVASGLALDFEH